MEFKKFHNKILVHMKTYDATIDLILVHFVSSKLGLYVSFRIPLYNYLLVMSPSRNFPARASPSYEGSEPSRAELEPFNFRAESELKFF